MPWGFHCGSCIAKPLDHWAVQSLPWLQDRSLQYLQVRRNGVSNDGRWPHKKGGRVGKLLNVRIIYKMATMITYLNYNVEVRAENKIALSIWLHFQSSFPIVHLLVVGLWSQVPWIFTLKGIRTLTVGAVLAGCVPEWWRCWRFRGFNVQFGRARTSCVQCPSLRQLAMQLA